MFEKSGYTTFYEYKVVVQDLIVKEASSDAERNALIAAGAQFIVRLDRLGMTTTTTTPGATTTTTPGATTTTTAGPPSIPVQHESTDTSSPTVNWAAASGADTYTVYYSTSAALTPSTYDGTNAYPGTPNATAGKITGITGTSQALASLTANGEYFIIVTASNTSGESAASNMRNALAATASTTYVNNFQSDSIGSGTLPAGWTNMGGSNSDAFIAANPVDASDHVFRLSGSSGLYALHANSTTAFTHVLGEMRAEQTNVATLTGLYQVSIFGLGFGADGHFKKYNGGSWVNLTNDTTYVANTWYFYHLDLNFSTHQVTLFINGVNKGTYAFESSASISTQVEVSEAAGSAAFSYNNIRMYT